MILSDFCITSHVSLFFILWPVFIAGECGRGVQIDPFNPLKHNSFYIYDIFNLTFMVCILLCIY
jgi:hypothetical protein